MWLIERLCCNLVIINILWWADFTISFVLWTLSHRSEIEMRQISTNYSRWNINEILIYSFKTHFSSTSVYKNHHLNFFNHIKNITHISRQHLRNLIQAAAGSSGRFTACPGDRHCLPKQQPQLRTRGWSLCSINQEVLRRRNLPPSSQAKQLVFSMPWRPRAQWSFICAICFKGLRPNVSVSNGVSALGQGSFTLPWHCLQLMPSKRSVGNLFFFPQCFK